MAEPLTEMLKGGHHNSLGRAEEVVEIVLADRARLDERFAGLGDSDELVRMRVGDALEKVCAERPEWFVPRVEAAARRGRRDRAAVGPVASGPDAPTPSSGALRRPGRQSHGLLKRNLTGSGDWIVLNNTMDALAEWAESDPALAEWLRGALERLSRDRRKAVAKRASKHLANLPG